MAYFGGRRARSRRKKAPDPTDPLGTYKQARRERIGGDQAREFGLATEERFLRICVERAWSFPNWMLGIERASREEDQHGVDFVASVWIEESCHAVPIQIKSSLTMKVGFMLRPNRKHILCLVVGRNSDGAVFDDLIKELSAKRKTLCKEEEKGAAK